MTGYLLDTNVLSEVRKGSRANATVRAWFAQVPSDALWLSVLVLGEIRQGIERCRERDPDTATNLDRWLTKLNADFHDRVLGIDQRVADEWGHLNARYRLPAVDGLLAATALSHGLVLVTRNVADVARSGVTTVNPFEAE